MLNVAQGDLGDSFYFESRPVTQIILEQAPVSAFIGVQAVILGLIPGLVFGVAAALWHNSVIDYTGDGYGRGWHRRAELRARPRSCSTGSASSGASYR